MDAHAAYCRRGPKHDNVAWVSQRYKCKEYDAAAVSRTISGHKPNTLQVKEGGDINGGCTEKNVWNEIIRNLVPWILDLSVIEWEGQKTMAVEKLRDAFNADFEYVPVTLN